MKNFRYQFSPTVYQEVTSNGFGRAFDSRSIKRYSYRRLDRLNSYSDPVGDVVLIKTTVYIKDVVLLSDLQPTLF